jgi:hypothetical protein
MLDVHVPHKSEHTWTDFFLHIATICVGLLIAIGLEQGVEALHRHHQRHQFEQDLRAEAIHNLHVAIYNLDILENLDHWQTQQVAEFDSAAAEGRAARYISEPPATRAYRLPSEAVWAVAQTGTLNLLPREEAQQFAHPYSVERFVAEDVKNLNQLMDQRDELLDSASTVPYLSRLVAGRNNTYDLSRLSKEDLARLRAVTASLIAQARGFQRDNRNLYSYFWGTLHGYLDEENYQRRSEVWGAFLNDGGTAGVLKKFPIPDEGTAEPKTLTEQVNAPDDKH